MSNEWDDLEADIDKGDEAERLRHQLNKTARQLHEVKHKHSDYLATVHEAAAEAIGQIRISNVPKPKADKRKRKEEICVPLLSDLQTGKVTPDYDSQVARERVMQYAAKIVEITEIQRLHHPVRHAVVPMLGDMVEGVDIFPGQQWLIDSTLYRQVFESTPSILVDFLRYLLAHFDTVTVEAVQGNHGRIGRRGVFGPEDNADRMVYKLTSMLMADEPRLTFRMSDPEGERAWYKIMNIGNYSAMLIHGDQIRGHSGFPWYGLGKKVNGWGSGGVPEEFNDLFMGHYHQLARVPLNKKAVYCNGSTESTNTYASENLAAQSDPSQWLLFVEPRAGRVSASYGVELG